MKFADFVEFSLDNLRKRRLRTFLTTFGVMIGIGALVSMISFGKGMQRNITRAFLSSGLFSSLTVLPGGPREPRADPDRREPTRPPQPEGSGAVLDDRAVAEIGRIPGVEAAFPDITIPALVSLDGREEFRLVQVVPPVAAGSGSIKVGWGKSFASDDEDSVIVSQSLLAEFGIPDPSLALGRELGISTVSFDFASLLGRDLATLLRTPSLPLRRESNAFPISGVTERTAFGGPGLFQNDVLIASGPARRLGRLPFNSVWDLFKIKDGPPGYSAVNVRLQSLQDLEPVKRRVQEMGFSTFALADQFGEIKRSWVYVDMMLAAVGMIAIVVAALGIMNTMIMSILERFREIGIMKAVGATDQDIRGIFFLESSVIGFIGGVFGFALGWTVSRIINRIINLTTARQGIPAFEYFAFPWWLFFGALAFSVLVSLAAGVYPAARAARIDPVEALRHD